MEKSNNLKKPAVNTMPSLPLVHCTKCGYNFGICYRGKENISLLMFIGCPIELSDEDEETIKKNDYAMNKCMHNFKEYNFKECFSEDTINNVRIYIKKYLEDKYNKIHENDIINI
jgi:hypothetical protein